MWNERAAADLIYDFVSPQRILFGWGRRVEVGTEAAGLGKRAFLVVGSRSLTRRGAIDQITKYLQSAGVEPLVAATISDEPVVQDVDRAAIALRELHAGDGDLVLGIGGGSAMDLAKAVAAMATNRHGSSVRDFLEGVGRGLKIEQAPLPVLAMPTTAGTGSEATKNAVISSYDPPFKKSLRSDRMIPRVVLVDPELACGVPRDTTAWTGMDAITQLMESYLSCRAKPIPQSLAWSGLELAVPAILEAVRDGTSRPAREAMAHAAPLSGMALANSGLGLAHGVAAALGVHCRVPHGLACAVMLPAAMRVNRPVREAEMARLGTLLTGQAFKTSAEAADSAVEGVRQLCSAVGVPRRLSELGVRREQIPALVASSRGNSMNGNPRQLTDAELIDLLEEML